MPWTASITAVVTDPTPTIAQVTIAYTDGTRTDTVTERVSEASALKQIVRNGITERERRDAIAALIAAPPIGAVDLSVPAPTQAQIDLQQFLTDYNNWVAVKTKLIDTGVLTGQETPCVNLLNKVKSEFKAGYLPYIA